MNLVETLRASETVFVRCFIVQKWLSRQLGYLLKGWEARHELVGEQDQVNNADSAIIFLINHCSVRVGLNGPSGSRGRLQGLRGSRGRPTGSQGVKG